MNEIIIYTNEAGGLVVMIPALECGLTVEEIAAKDVPDGVPFQIVKASDLPADRTFRDAWEASGAEVVENLGKCKLIAHDKRREARAAEFAPLDVEATIPAKASEAEAKRQAIREKYAAIQNRIDAAKSAAELRAEMAALGA